MIKCNFFIIFKGLRRGPIKSFHVVQYFSSKLTTNLMLSAKCNKEHSLGCKMCIKKVYGAKCNQKYSLGC